MPFFAIRKAMIAIANADDHCRPGPGDAGIRECGNKRRRQEVQGGDREYCCGENAACRDRRLSGFVAHLGAKELDLLSE